MSGELLALSGKYHILERILELFILLSIWLSFSRSITHAACVGVVKAIRWFPVAFVLSVFFWSYYAFVVQLIYLRTKSLELQIGLLVLYHVIVVFFLWSFVATIVTEPGKVPESCKLSQYHVGALNSARSEEEWKEILQGVVQEMGVAVCQRSMQGAIRYCEVRSFKLVQYWIFVLCFQVCFVIKPDRAHHCSVCERCILKMDHHCPWVNNCVGFGNYKFFLLFVSYGYAYCILLIGGSLSYVLEFWTDGFGQGDDKVGALHLLFLLIVSGLFFLFLSSLFWYHLFLLVYNRSVCYNISLIPFKINS